MVNEYLAYGAGPRALAVPDGSSGPRRGDPPMGGARRRRWKT